MEWLWLVFGTTGGQFTILILESWTKIILKAAYLITQNVVSHKDISAVSERSAFKYELDVKIKIYKKMSFIFKDLIISLNSFDLETWTISSLYDSENSKKSNFFYLKKIGKIKGLSKSCLEFPISILKPDI